MKKLYTVQEKTDYKEWHKNRYNKDLFLAENIIDMDQSWSIIIGYYAMHNITKLFLATKNIYLIGGEHIHDQCIKELEKISYTELKNLKDTLILLKEAKEKFDSLFLEPKEWPVILKHAKFERSNANYYSNKDSSEAKGFINEIVRPYISTFEKLIKDDR